MSDLNNAKAFLATMAEVLETDDVVAEFVNNYFSQLFSNDARLKESLDGLGFSSARNVVLSGPRTAAGLARLFRDRYGENLCYGGTAISGGDATGYGKSNAFDGDTTTNWNSSQNAANQSATAYIGYDFGTGVARHIRKIKLTQIADTRSAVTSVKVQNSSDGSAWTAVATVNTYAGINIIELPASNARRYWRILANANLTNTFAWTVSECAMFELLNASLTNADLIVLGDAVFTFAAGMRNGGPVDYRYANAVDRALTLGAADADTIPLSYGPNICRGGAAVSDSDYGGLPKENAFNGDTSTGWGSNRTAANQSGASYIGYDFGVGVTKAIRKVTLWQTSNAVYNMTAVKIQYSDNGAAWTDATPTTVIDATANAKPSLTVPAVGAHRYWRILAMANLGGSTAWTVLEVEMYEALQTHYVYADYNPYAKTISLGSTKVKPKRYKAGGQAVGGQVPNYFTADLCSDGTAIADSASNPAANAFDDNTGTAWIPLNRYSANQNGVCYIGYDFGAGVTKHIRRISFTQTGQAANCMPSVKVQRSDDGAAWTDVATAAVSTTPLQAAIIDLPVSQAARYWRLLAITNLENGYGWNVAEVEMYSYVAPSTVGTGSTTIQQTAYVNQIIGGTALSSGAYGGSWPASNAFDGSEGTLWISAQAGGGLTGVAYIGYDFGAAKTIRRIVCKQLSTGVTSLLVQKSDDGAAWTTVTTQNGVTASNVFEIPDGHTARYWRLLANSERADGQTGGDKCWGVSEVEMLALVTTSVTVLGDDPIYTDNLAVTGAAISGGDLGATTTKEMAFVGDNGTTVWASSQTGAAVNGAAYIGYDFGAARHIRKMAISWYAANGTPASAKIQRSTDGAAWNDVKTITPTPGVTTVELLDASVASRYWRILATAGLVAGNSFAVNEVTMHEIGTDVNLYDPYNGETKHYDGSTWETKIRLFLGEVTVDGAGNIVASTTYPYNVAQVKAKPADDSDEAVTLGQFLANVATPGWMKIPVWFNGKQVTLILQWGTYVNTSTVIWPIEFPNAFLAPLGTTLNYASGTNISGFTNPTKTGATCGNAAVSLWYAVLGY